MRSPPRHPARYAALILALALVACAPAGSGSGTPITASEAVSLVLAQQSRFAGIGPLDENLIGQAAWYEVAEASDGWQVLIRIGWGDCPAGCISQHRWSYAVGRDGSIELLSEDGDPMPDATGVRGVVTAGPTCPVVTDPPDPDCADRTVAGAVQVVNDAAGVEVARATAGADGTFSIELAPGAYRVVAQPVEGLMGTPAPIDLQVEAGQPMTELQVVYDTGIR
ncbi:MAG: carboxypeptidase-like regulatory domain-containing protein [Chloroflexota bacterium]